MADGYQDEAAEFAVDEVEEIVKKAIHTTLNDHEYNGKKVNEWTNQIVTICLKELQEKSRPFKYVITSVIMQKTGAGLVTATSMNWDTTKDGYCKIPWQNNTMHCIVTIYGAAVTVDDPQDD